MAPASRELTTVFDILQLFFDSLCSSQLLFDRPENVELCTIRLLHIIVIMITTLDIYLYIWRRFNVGADVQWNTLCIIRCVIFLDGFIVFDSFLIYSTSWRHLASRLPEKGMLNISWIHRVTLWDVCLLLHITTGWDVSHDRGLQMAPSEWTAVFLKPQKLHFDLFKETLEFYFSLSGVFLVFFSWNWRMNLESHSRCVSCLKQMFSGCCVLTCRRSFFFSFTWRETGGDLNKLTC